MAHMTSRDSRNIYYESWQASSPRAVIQILTGLGEMAWYYKDLAKKANQLGFSVYLHEYRKHGRTEADYGDGNIFLTFASDAAQMLTRIRQENPAKRSSSSATAWAPVSPSSPSRRKAPAGTASP